MSLETEQLESKAKSDESTQNLSTAEPRAIRHIDDGSDRTVTSRSAIRMQLQSDIEQFLRNGGAVQTIAPHVTADPPTKPISNYGGRPI